MTLPAKFPALASLEADARALLEREAHPVQLADGTSLFQPGDACRNYLLVTEGEVVVRLLDENGHSIVLYRVGPGQTCVLTTSCLMAHSPYAAEGVVDKQLKGFTLPAAAFEKLLALSPVFRRFVFSAFGTRLEEMMGLVNEVAFRRLDQRLAEHLLRSGANSLHTTHQQIADELGTAREVVSRQLKEWERQGWLRLERGSISLLNPAALRQQAQPAQV